MPRQTPEQWFKQTAKAPQTPEQWFESTAASQSEPPPLPQAAPQPEPPPADPEDIQIAARYRRLADPGSPFAGTTPEDVTEAKGRIHPTRFGERAALTEQLYEIQKERKYKRRGGAAGFASGFLREVGAAPQKGLEFLQSEVARTVAPGVSREAAIQALPPGLKQVAEIAPEAGAMALKYGTGVGTATYITSEALSTLLDPGLSAGQKAKNLGTQTLSMLLFRGGGPILRKLGGKLGSKFIAKITREA